MKLVSLSQAMEMAKTHVASNPDCSFEFGVRHGSRRKKDPVEGHRQLLTVPGWLQARLLGQILAADGIEFASATASDQDRSRYTLEAIRDGYVAHNKRQGETCFPSILQDYAIGDFSGSAAHDQLIASALADAKEHGRQHGVETERAIFEINIGRKAMIMRALGYAELFRDHLTKPGGHVSVAHAPVLDVAGTIMEYLQKHPGDSELSQWQMEGYPEHPIEYCEGILILGHPSGQVLEVVQYTYPEPEELEVFLNSVLCSNMRCRAR